MIGLILKTLNAIPLISAQYIAELRSYVAANYPHISAGDVERVLAQLLGQVLENQLAEFGVEYRQKLKDLLLETISAGHSFELYASDVLKSGLQLVREKPAFLGELARWIGQFDFPQTSKVAVVDYLLTQHASLGELHSFNPTQASVATPQANLHQTVKPTAQPTVSTGASATTMGRYATPEVTPQNSAYQTAKPAAQPAATTGASATTMGRYATPEVTPQNSAYQTAKPAAQPAATTGASVTTMGRYATPEVTPQTNAYQPAKPAGQPAASTGASVTTMGRYATPEATPQANWYQTAKLATQPAASTGASATTMGRYATPEVAPQANSYQTAAKTEPIGATNEPSKAATNAEPIKPGVSPTNLYLGKAEAPRQETPESKGDIYEGLLGRLEDLERMVKRKAGKFLRGHQLSFALGGLAVILAVGGVWFLAWTTSKDELVADQNGPIGIVEDYTKKEPETSPKAVTENQTVDETVKKREYNRHTPIPNVPHTIIVGYVKEKTPNGIVDTPVRRYFDRKLRINATAYDLSVASCGKEMTHPEYGITRTGTRAKRGRTIAVDPRVIPLGRKVYVAFPRKYKHLNGIYTAEDTGSMVKGYRIDVFFGADAAGENRISKEARRFGRRKVEVYLLQD